MSFINKKTRQISYTYRKNCQYCGNEIEHRQKFKSACCSSCDNQKQKAKRAIARNELHKETFKNLSSGKVGAVQENFVINDLMLRGFEVFKACSPSQSCDLIVLINGKLFRVECKTVGLNVMGEHTKPSVKDGTWDILAKITHAGIIKYDVTSEAKRVIDLLLD